MSSQGNLGSFGAKHMPDCTGPTCSSYSLTQLSANSANQKGVKESQQHKTQLQKVCFVFVWHKLHWFFFFFPCERMFLWAGVGHLIKLKPMPLEAEATVAAVSEKKPNTPEPLFLRRILPLGKCSFLKGTLCPDGHTLNRWGTCKSTLTCQLTQEGCLTETAAFAWIYTLMICDKTGPHKCFIFSSFLWPSLLLSFGKRGSRFRPPIRKNCYSLNLKIQLYVFIMLRLLLSALLI